MRVVHACRISAGCSGECMCMPCACAACGLMPCNICRLACVQVSQGIFQPAQGADARQRHAVGQCLQRSGVITRAGQPGSQGCSHSAGPHQPGDCWWLPALCQASKPREAWDSPGCGRGVATAEQICQPAGVNGVMLLLLLAGEPRQPSAATSRPRERA